MLLKEREEVEVVSVQSFINNIEDERKRTDCQMMLKLMEIVTQKNAQMWGKNMIGFGRYHFKYESGREGDFFVTGFSPNQQSVTVYLMPGFDMYKELLKKIGKYKMGNGCLYIDRLEDVSLKPLACLIELTVEKMHQTYVCE